MDKNMAEKTRKLEGQQDWDGFCLATCSASRRPLESDLIVYAAATQPLERRGAWKRVESCYDTKYWFQNAYGERILFEEMSNVDLGDDIFTERILPRLEDLQERIHRDLPTIAINTRIEDYRLIISAHEKHLKEV